MGINDACIIPAEDSHLVESLESRCETQEHVLSNEVSQKSSCSCTCICTSTQDKLGLLAS